MRRSCTAAFAAMLLMPTYAQAGLAHLTLTIQGLEPPTGTVEVSLFNSAETFMKKPVLQRRLPVNGKNELTIEFSGVLDGDYAIVVVHDENDNGVLDTGFLGFGGEKYGFSNNATPWVGRPSFDAAKFSIGDEDVKIAIKLD